MNDMTAITAEQLREAREALSRPAHLAEGLPGEFYGPSFFELERQALFPHGWCAVSVAGAIPKPGDVLPIDLAGWPILLVRGRDDEIRAFHNICRHRAMRPVAEACNVKLIRCPWHSWSYDLRGDLVATPEIGGAGIHSHEGFDKSTLGLKPIPVGRWLNYVFVNIDGKAGPFADYIRPATELLAEVELGGMCYAGRFDDLYHGNWKLFTEGFIEDYHLPFGHPQLHAHKFRNTTPCAADGVYAGGWMDFEGGHGEAADAEPVLHWAGLPPIMMKNGRRSSRMLVVNIFPTAMILLGADELMLGVLLPDGPGRTKVELHCHFQGEAATAPEYQQARERSMGMWNQVIPQDYPFVAGTQATVGARDAAGIRTRFSPYWEQPVLNYQRMVLDALGDLPGANI